MRNYRVFGSPVLRFSVLIQSTMNTTRRDLIIIGLLFAVLVAFVAYVPRLQTSEQPTGASTYSSDDGGALALFRWTQALGYDSRRLEYRDFMLDQHDAALIMLNPSEAITLDEADQITRWVEDGGMLIVADDASALFGASRTLLRELGVRREVYSSTLMLEHATAVQPLLDQPPASAVPVDTGYVLAPDMDAYVTVLSAASEAVLIGSKRGAGYVYVSSATRPFTNAGLRDPNSAALVLNLLRRVPPGGRVQFDEFHHGHVAPPSTGGILLANPLGWAALYAVLAVGMYLMLSGRRFGRPVPLKAEIARRSSAEYVESMADLFQRGGKRAYILRHFYQSFKRRLARPVGVSPQLDDAAFVHELGRAREVDEPALLALLGRLRDERIGEADLVRVVADAEAMIAQWEQRR
jgi:hypothetical protein